MDRIRDYVTIEGYLRGASQRDPVASQGLERCVRHLATAKARALRLPPEDAEDVAQEVCLLALADGGAALARVRPQGTPLAAWVAKVAHHKLVDRVRARARQGSDCGWARNGRRRAQQTQVAAQRKLRLGVSGGGGRAPRGVDPFKA